MRRALMLLLIVFPLQAQAQAPQPIISPEVHADGRVS